jgi:hypothetical protein
VHALSSYGELWIRSYSYSVREWSSASFHKLMLYNDCGGGNMFGGPELWVARGMRWGACAEGTTDVALKSRAHITPDTWHCRELEYRRNLDALPNAAIRYDNVRTVRPDGHDPAANGDATQVVWNNGRIYWSTPNNGPSNTSARLGGVDFLATRNGGNTDSGTLYLDRIAVSSLGRIGC